MICRTCSTLSIGRLVSSSHSTGLIARRRIHLANQHHVHGDRRQFAICTPGWTQRHAAHPYDNLGFARLTRLSPATGFRRRLLLSPADLDRFAEQRGLFQEIFAKQLFSAFSPFLQEQSAIPDRPAQSNRCGVVPLAPSTNTS